MKKILVLIAGLAVISCADDPKVDYTVISGKIENKKDAKVFIYDNGFQKEIALNDDGSFVDTLRLDTGYFQFRHERNTINVFITPAKDLNIKTDATQFLDSMQYDGKVAAENNYLLEKTRINRKRDAAAIFSQEEAGFLKTVTEIKEETLKRLKETKGLDEEFIAFEKQNIEFAHLLNISRYPDFYVNYFKHPDYVPSEAFKKQLKEVDYDNEENFQKFRVYRDLALSHYSTKMDPEEDIKGAIALVKGIKSESIKKELIQELGYYISPSFKEVDFLYQSLSELSPDEDFKKELTKKYTSIQNLVAGKDSPAFDYENHKGGKTSLADLQGKYVYIDVWATWCGPCIAEIPSLKKVEKEYHDKNIAFVSISIDTKKAYETWKKMVVDKELGGVQLIADNAWQSQFVTDYAIEGIPRFILIDPNGKIVNADAPRPSNPELIELFQKLNI